MNLQVSSRVPAEDLLTGPNLRFRIGEHVVDTGALRVLTRPDLPRLTNKAVAVLIELVRHVGQTVTRDQLLDRVWTGRFPTPDVLTQAIKELRRAFADDSKPPQYIETIPKIGYRLVASVLMLGDPESGIVLEATVPRALAIGEQANEPLIAGRADAPVARRRTRMMRFLAAAACGAVLATVAILFMQQRMREMAAAPQAIWKISDARALTSDPGAERRPHLAPDGTRVAFAAIDSGGGPNRIVARSIEPSQRVRISGGGAQEEALPVWSPDGTRIAFERAGEKGCTLIVASSLGGDEREVGSCHDWNVSYYDWTPDARGLITAQSSTAGGGDLALVTLDLDSGGRQFLQYARTPADQDLEPHYSPDGTFIAFRRGVAPYSDLYVMPANGGEVRQVTHIASRIRGHAWSRDGSALIFASNFAGTMALYTVDVASGSVQALGVSPAEYPSAARNTDAIAYEIPRTQSQLAQLSLDGANATPKTLAPSTGSDYAAALSPDGNRIAFISNRSGQFQLWLYDRTSEITTPLTDKADTPVFWPRWSADGSKIVAVALVPGPGRQLIEIDVASRRQRVLSRPDESILFGGYGAEPDSYLFAIGSSGSNNQLVVVRHPRSANESRQLIESGIAFAQVDPELRAVFYTTSAGGLYRYDFDRGNKRFVSAKISSLTANGWRIVDGHIWYLTDFEVKPIVLHDLDPETGEDRVLSRMDVSVKDLNFTVMPDRRSLVFSEIGTEDTDIGMFTLTRTDTH